jgi:hypothetical protein
MELREKLEMTDAKYSENEEKYTAAIAKLSQNLNELRESGNPGASTLDTKITKLQAVNEEYAKQIQEQKAAFDQGKELWESKLNFIKQ